MRLIVVATFGAELFLMRLTVVVIPGADLFLMRLMVVATFGADLFLMRLIVVAILLALIARISFRTLLPRLVRPGRFSEGSGFLPSIKHPLLDIAAHLEDPGLNPL